MPRGGIRIYPFNEGFFDSIDTPEKAYWLGFIAADGGVNGLEEGQAPVLALNLADRDREHLETFQRVIGRDAPIRTATSSYGTGVARLLIVSRPFVEALMCHGVRPKKSMTIEPWDGPPDLMRHYWRGVFDGDGSISKVVLPRRTDPNYQSWKVSLSGNHSMVSAFQQFVIAHGGTPGWLGPHSRIWKVMWGGHRPTQAAVAPLYSDGAVSLPRKHTLAMELLRDLDRKPSVRRRIEVAGVVCRYCDSTDIASSGRSEDGRRRYRCRTCGRYGRESSNHT
jgi:hypothetical protein